MKSKLSELASEYVEKYPDDWEMAAKRLLTAIDKDAKLKRSILDEAVYTAVKETVKNAGIRGRRPFWQSDDDAVREAQEEGRLCKPGEETKPSQFLARPEKTWMNYPMANGKKIGDCTFVEMGTWAVKFIGIGNTYLHHGLCFQAVADKGKRFPDALVKDKLTDKALARIMESPRVPETVAV